MSTFIFIYKRLNGKHKIRPWTGIRNCVHEQMRDLAIAGGDASYPILDAMIRSPPSDLAALS